MPFSAAMFKQIHMLTSVSYRGDKFELKKGSSHTIPGQAAGEISVSITTNQFRHYAQVNMTERAPLACHCHLVSIAKMQNNACLLEHSEYRAWQTVD
eukprot:804591-Pelagomonas_calceolata.AAC.12